MQVHNGRDHVDMNVACLLLHRLHQHQPGAQDSIHTLLLLQA
jgi:hypothetical protein